MGWACIAQAVFYYNLCEETIFYTVMLTKLVTWPWHLETSPWRTGMQDVDNYKDSYWTIRSYIISNRTQRSVFKNTDLMLNSLVFIDLSWTLQNPFYPREKRSPLFFGIAFASAFLNVVLQLTHYASFRGDIVELDFRSLETDDFNFYYYVNIMILVYVFICFFKVSIRLAQPGTSRQLRNRVIMRHVSFYLIYLVHFLPNFLMYEPKDLSEPHYFELSIRHYFHDNRNSELTMFLMANISGTFLAFIRFSEPMVFQEFVVSV